MRNDAELYAEASAHASALGLMSGAARQKAISARIEQLRAEDQTAQAATDAIAEAAAERARIASIYRLGLDTNRPRQAARLALLGPVSAAQAATILASATPDAKADDAALTLPASAGTFGTPAARAERGRILSVIGHADAAGRFRAASSLALDGDMDPVAAASLLTALPLDPAPIEGPGERAAGMSEFGADFEGGKPASEADRSAQAWRRAVENANASLGAGAVAPHRPGVAQ